MRRSRSGMLQAAPGSVLLPELRFVRSLEGLGRYLCPHLIKCVAQPARSDRLTITTAKAATATGDGPTELKKAGPPPHSKPTCNKCKGSTKGRGSHVILELGSTELVLLGHHPAHSLANIRR
jgi:hypothetical protein